MKYRYLQNIGEITLKQRVQVLHLSLQLKTQHCVLVSAAAGNKSATRPPFPRRGAEENGKKTGRNRWVGIRAV